MYRAAIWTVASFLGVLLLALVFTIGYVSSDDDGGAAAQDTTRDRDTEPFGSDIDFDTLNEILDILKDDYFGRDFLSDDQLYEAAINGMLDSLADTGTFYIDPRTYEFSLDSSGTYEGIGATVSQQDEEIRITSFFPDSGAEAAGVLAGDVVLAVDGESTAGWPLDKAVRRIRGPEGTTVTITVRHVDGTEEELTVTRTRVRVASITTSPPGGVLRDALGNDVSDFAYLRIFRFTAPTPDEVEAVVREAEESGKRGLIIDLRGNPGGLLDETVATADLFLDGGTILIEIDRDGNERVFNARTGGAALTIHIVLLMDEFSASGAEVLAAALRDNDRGIIIGETSFGKGTVNSPRELEDGGAIYVTIGQWLTPAGVLIDGVGISPDIEVTPGPFDPLYSPLEDVQVHRAIEHLRSLTVGEEAPVPVTVAP